MATPKKRCWTKEEVNTDFVTHFGIVYWKTGPRANKVAGWKDTSGYQLIRYKGVLVRAHNIVWLMIKGVWPDKELDHKDTNPQNNSIDNLRESDRNEQGMNQKLQARRAGKYKGVHQSSSGKFYVKIKFHGKQLYYGSYESELEAAMVYNINAEKLFGKFANYNKMFEDIGDEDD